MTDRAKLHMSEQQALALLGPVRSSLDELERRLDHYLERLTMPSEDEEAIRAARSALATARAEVERLWRGSVRR